MKIHLAFIDRQSEKRFAEMVTGTTEEIGGLLFIKYGQIKSMHHRTHRRLFEVNSVGLITHWIVCPNISNLRDREYQVSDLKQLIGIAEQTEKACGGWALHWHTHPNGSVLPSDPDLDFWWKHFNQHRSAYGVVAAAGRQYGAGFSLACHHQVGQERKLEMGRFWSWRWINSVIRADEKARAKKA